MQRIISLLLMVIPLSANNWQPSIEPRGITNGYRQGVGGELFFPVRQDGISLLFGQALAGRFQEEWVGSLGVGYRRFAPSCCWAWGINGFLDGTRDGETRFGQGGLGVEALGLCWEARLNGYLPFTRVEERYNHHSESLFLQGTTLLQHTSGYCLRERSYAGFDFEGGYGRDICRGSLWGYAGYYYLSTSVLENIQGPRLRLVYRYDGLLKTCASQLIAGLLYEYDQVHGNRVGVEIGIRIPLGHLAKSALCPPSSLLRRMGNRVVRQEGILRRCETFTTPQQTQPLLSPRGFERHVLFVQANGEGEGREDNPTTLKHAIEKGGPGAYLILSRKGGDIKTDGVTLLPDQRLLGFGEWGSIQLQEEGLTLPLNDHAGRVTLIGSGNQPVITLADGAHVSGIGVQGGKILIEGIEGASVANTHITTSKDYGLELKNAANVILSNLTIRGKIGEWALLVEGVKGLTVTSLTTRDQAENGIKTKGSQHLLFEDLDLELQGDDGILAFSSKDLTIKRTKIDGESTRHQLDCAIVLKDTENVSLEDIYLKGVRGDALLVKNGVGTRVRNLNVRSMADGAIRVEGGRHFALHHSSLIGSKETLVNLIDASGNLTFTHNVFKGAPTGLICRQNAKGGQIDLLASGNQFADVDRGLVMRTGSYARDSQFDYTVSGNRFERIGGTGILVVHEAFDKGPANLMGTLSRNTLIGTQGPAIHLFSDLSIGPNHRFSTVVQANTIREAAKEAIRAEVDGDSGGDLSFRFLGNQDLQGGETIPYSVKVGARHQGPASLSIRGNSSTREGAAISLVGELVVSDLEGLSRENGGMQIQ